MIRQTNIPPMKGNKQLLIKANQAITKGDNEGFLAFCTEDTVWNFLGDITLNGKEALRQWMKENYVEPPKFNVSNMVEEGDFVVALGTITSKDKNGKIINSLYSDVWRFENGKMAELQAFVIENS